MIFKEVNEKKYREVIADCYKTDKDWESKYSVKSGKGLDACVDYMIEILDTGGKYLQFIGVYKNKKIVGYYAYEPYLIEEDGEAINILVGLFTTPEIRNKKDKKEFWNKIKKDLGDGFITCAFKVNKRFSDFLETNGGEKMSESEYKKDKLIFYKF